MKADIRRIISEYPQPLASAAIRVWSQDDANAKLDMVCKGFEATARYMALIGLAHYIERRTPSEAQEKLDARTSMHLSKASFGNWVGLTRELGRYAEEQELDFWGVRLNEKLDDPELVAVMSLVGKKPKTVTINKVFNTVVQIRNKKQGHGVASKGEAKEFSDVLVPAFVSLLKRLEFLSKNPPVLVERVELTARNRFKVSFGTLVGRADPFPDSRDNIQGSDGSPPVLPRTVYLWGPQGSPVLLSPLVVVRRKRLYVLSKVDDGIPRYQDDGPDEGDYDPDQLLTMFEERAPYLLGSGSNTEAPDPPAYQGVIAYRQMLETALQDGVVTADEWKMLLGCLDVYGLSEADVEPIHLELGFSPELVVDSGFASGEAPVDGVIGEPQPCRALLLRIQNKGMDSDTFTTRDLWFACGEAMTLGREASRADVQVAVEPLDDPENVRQSMNISSRHLEVRVTSKGGMLTDPGSSNGTWMGTRRLSVGMTQSIGQETEVSLAKVLTLQFEPLLGDDEEVHALHIRRVNNKPQLAYVLAPEGLGIWPSTEAFVGPRQRNGRSAPLTLEWRRGGLCVFNHSHSKVARWPFGESSVQVAEGQCHALKQHDRVELDHQWVMFVADVRSA